MSRVALKKKRKTKTSHIIDTATQVFAEKGYHGALTDEIASRAEISKRSMYYYVGDKETLYESVLNHLIEKTGEVFDCFFEDTETIEDTIRVHVRTLSKVAKYRELHAIVFREMFAGGEIIPVSFFMYMDGFINRFKESFSSMYINGKTALGKTDAFVMGWMIFSFFTMWEAVMPFLNKFGYQKDILKELAFDVNDKLSEEIELILGRFLESLSKGEWRKTGPEILADRGNEKIGDGLTSL
jgi:AcrR family transcriptional regulator